MKLFYFIAKNGVGNFGDELNPWIWNKFIPEIFKNNDSAIFMGFGTILNSKINLDSKKIAVFSSGAGYGEMPNINKNWKIYCLRGPLSAKKLGISMGLAITDGAVLVNKFLKPSPYKKYRCSFMPHIMQAYYGEKAWQDLCNDLGLNYIDPRWQVDKVLENINNTEFLITEALHGAIVADALRIPWTAIKTTEQVYPFKWEDWCASLNLKYNPTHLYPLWDHNSHYPIKTIKRFVKKIFVKKQIVRLLKENGRSLSTSSHLKDLISKLEEKALLLKNDIQSGMFD